MNVYIRKWYKSVSVVFVVEVILRANTNDIETMNLIVKCNCNSNGTCNFNLMFVAFCIWTI